MRLPDWKPFTTYRGIEIERRGTPATQPEYRIEGMYQTFICLTCCKREADKYADKTNRIMLP
jgi:hypothetical protein